MDEIYHFIEKHIMGVLTHCESARFSEMRPKRVDSNLYSYHLKKLLKEHYIIKDGKDYRLSPLGLQYVTRLSVRTGRPAVQAKITASILIKNSKNQILLTKRNRQPFIHTWSLPRGKTRSDEPIAQATERVLIDEAGVRGREFKHIGDAYLRCDEDGVLISNIFTHVFTAKIDDDTPLQSHTKWFDAREIDAHKMPMTPGMDRIPQMVDASKGKHFFAEITEVL